MSDLDFERKHAEDLQRLRGFRLLDDDFMNKVFEDKACAEFLLQSGKILAERGLRDEQFFSSNRHILVFGNRQNVIQIFHIHIRIIPTFFIFDT